MIRVPTPLGSLAAASRTRHKIVIKLGLSCFSKKCSRGFNPRAISFLPTGATITFWPSINSYSQAFVGFWYLAASCLLKLSTHSRLTFCGAREWEPPLGLPCVCFYSFSALRFPLSSADPALLFASPWRVGFPNTYILEFRSFLVAFTRANSLETPLAATPLSSESLFPPLLPLPDLAPLLTFKPILPTLGFSLLLVMVANSFSFSNCSSFSESSGVSSFPESYVLYPDSRFPRIAFRGKLDVDTLESSSEKSESFLNTGRLPRFGPLLSLNLLSINPLLSLVESLFRYLVSLW